MRYAEASGRAFSRKPDYVNSIVRACARKLLLLYLLYFSTVQEYRINSLRSYIGLYNVFLLHIANTFWIYSSYIQLILKLAVVNSTLAMYSC